MADEQPVHTDAPPAPAGGNPAGPPSASALEALVRRASRAPRTPWGAAGGPRAATGAPGGGPTAPIRVAIAVVVAAAAVGWLGWSVLGRPAPIEDRMPVAPAGEDGAGTSGPGRAAAGTGNPPGDGTGSGAGSGPDAAAALVVHVAGAVRRPGVVDLAAGARVSDALQAAGGLAEGADGDRLNLAAPLRDGARVFVPLVGQPVPAELSPQAPGAGQGGGTGGDPPADPVDLNLADAPALESLPGIGPATAAAILEHREREGPFASVEDLLDVRGIGEAKLEALEGLVVVG